MTDATVVTVVTDATDATVMTAMTDMSGIEWFEVRPGFPHPRLPDVAAKVREILQGNSAIHALPEGAAVAITAGSRGIDRYLEVLRAIVGYVKGVGLQPFLVPAMGSHGGATADGQRNVLSHLGITEESVGAPIRSSMDAELLGTTPGGLPVYMDRNAYRAEGIIVVNRIKAHTAFRGAIESGLSKMIAVGLGKLAGASYIHSAGVHRMAAVIEEIAAFALQHAPIAMGIGLIENGYDEIADMAAVDPREWHEQEAAWLRKSKALSAHLPVDEADLLLIEQMGKGFSGSGMDPNIIGRWRIAGVEEPARPRIGRIVVLELADHSFGNAQGVGLADFTTQALADRIDRHITYTSTIASTFLQRAMLPMVFPTERDAFAAAVRSLGPGREMASLKMIQIANTLHLDRMLVSGPVLEAMRRDGRTFQLCGQHRLTFSDRGELAVRLTRNRTPSEGGSPHDQ